MATTKPSNALNRDTDWWEIEDAADRARAVFTLVKEIEQRQSSIQDGNIRHAREYSGYTPAALNWSLKGGLTRERTQNTKNLIRSVCDTATALISKTRPKPTPVTDGAEWSLQQQAQQLDRFLVGAYSRSGLYQVAQRCFHDSTVFGTGIWKLIPRSGKNPRVDVERVLSDDLIIDEDECPNWPTPYNYYHRMRVRADVLARRYPEHKEAIEKARGKQSMTWAGRRMVRPEEVVVIEAYHLPIEEGGEGRRILILDGYEIESDPWTHAWAPFVVLYWAPPISGFYGDGVAYRLDGRQQRINYMYRWITRVQDLIVVPRVWVDSAGGPLRIQLSNEIGEIVQTRGKVEFQTPQGVSAEYYQWLDNLEKGGYEEEGISQASASNRLPQGLESAPAQREYSYKEGQRFAPVSQRWEEAVAQETAYKMLALYKDLAEAGHPGSEKWSNKTLFEQIEWDDVDMDTNRYQIRVEASSLESLTPAARTQAAIELSQTGWIKEEEGRRLLGHPDLQRSYDLGTSAIELAEFNFQRLLRLEPVSVDPRSDLEIEFEVITAGYRLIKTRRAPDRVLKHVANYLDALDVAMTPPPMPGMDPAMAGMAGPIDPMATTPTPAISIPAAQGLNVPFSQGGTSNEGI
jgi:hypothetical protein